MHSLSYHAASGTIAAGLSDGFVEIWQAAPQAAHACVRGRLADAQEKVAEIKLALGKADVGLRQQMSREQELKRSIADLEAKCACICAYISILT